jgi:recombination protein RecT
MEPNEQQGIFGTPTIDTGVKPETPPILEKKEPTPEPKKVATATTPATQTAAQIAALKSRELQDATTNAVLSHLMDLQSDGKLQLPDNYSAGTQLKLAWLKLQEIENKNGQRAVDFCTKESIVNALLEMTVQGLSVAKKQGDFIMYGNKLQFQLEYHGVVALARRLGGVVGVPTANVIYDDDEFQYEIDVTTGKKRIVKHIQDFMNIDSNKIKGAYATLQLADGSTYVEIMNIGQIRQAWMQGATKGQSPAHKNFPDQMCMKTVISRACKLFVSTSDDSGLYMGTSDGEDASEKITQTPTTQPEKKEKREVIDIPSEVADDKPKAPKATPNF